MGTARLNRRQETRKLKDLKSYPKQADFFDDLPPEELKALADDIKRNGVRIRVKILPDGTIISGHQRVRALKLLGRTDITVIVCHDLANADPATIEREFLEDNFRRRQLDLLAKARVALRLFVIEKKRPRGDLYHCDVAEARDRVGQAIGMSGRNLQRYWRVLKTPLAVQNAFRAGQLGLVLAGTVADLDAEIQERIAGRIQAGEPADQVVAPFLSQRGTRERSTSEVVADFAHALANRVRAVEAIAEHIGPSTAAKHRKNFEAARKVIQKMLDLAQS
jgi:hypothetical protein